MRFVKWFREIGIEDVPLVGGKNASLGEMYNFLTKKGLNIPNGFAITSEGYDYFVEKTGIKEQIKKLLEGLDVSDVEKLSEVGYKIRSLFLEADFPKELREEIEKAYEDLEKEYFHGVDVAVRSSATAEDLPDASFAGQQETFLNIKGKKMLLEACKKCFASLFTNRAISYREDKHFDHFKVKLSIGVQKMVRSDLASSGVMFSLDTESGFNKVVLINASYGLGENIVQGAVNPDQYYVFKDTLSGYRPIISKKKGDKKMKMIYSYDGHHTTKNVPVPEEDRVKFVLSDDEILQLAKWATIIEEHYTKKRGTYCPVDIEWAKDGIDGRLYILQARPETVHSRKDKRYFERYVLEESGNVLLEGVSVGDKIGVGRVL